MWFESSKITNYIGTIVLKSFSLLIKPTVKTRILNLQPTKQPNSIQQYLIHPLYAIRTSTKLLKHAIVESVQIAQRLLLLNFNPLCADSHVKTFTKSCQYFLLLITSICCSALVWKLLDKVKIIHCICISRAQSYMHRWARKPSYTTNEFLSEIDIVITLVIDISVENTIHILLKYIGNLILSRWIQKHIVLLIDNFTKLFAFSL